MSKIKLSGRSDRESSSPDTGESPTEPGKYESITGGVNVGVDVVAKESAISVTSKLRGFATYSLLPAPHPIMLLLRVSTLPNTRLRAFL